MATNTAGNTARHSTDQSVRAIYFPVSFDDTGIASGIAKAKLPAGAKVLNTMVHVTAAFDATTTNVLTVGTNSSSYNNIIAAGDVDESAIGAYTVFRGGDITLSSATDVYVKYTQTGDAAAAGAAVVVISYVEALV